MIEKEKNFIIIDSNSIIHRAYHALPPLTTKKGELINAVYGFLLVFLKTIREFRPDFIVACFDFPAPTFRHKKFKEYKAKRPPVPKELYLQIPIIKEILKNFNVPIFEKEGFEADDIIGTTTNLISKNYPSSIEIIILSGDSDSLQLVDPKTKVFILTQGVKKSLLFDEKLVKEKYQGLNPKQLIDFKSLRGDPSDNIPGVRGVGEKTAFQLIKNFNSLENIYETIEGQNENAKKIKPEIKEKLTKYKEQAFLSKYLVQLDKNIKIDFDLDKCRWRKYDKEKVIQTFQDFGFRSLIERLPETNI